MPLGDICASSRAALPWRGTGPPPRQLLPPDYSIERFGELRFVVDAKATAKVKWHSTI
jgi:hypothetical protein